MNWLERIKAGERSFAVQFARGDNESGTAPNWKPAQNVTLSVTIRETAIGKPGRSNYRPAGEVICVTPIGMVWSEYGERDFDANFDSFECEGWRMRLAY